MRMPRLSLPGRKAAGSARGLPVPQTMPWPLWQTYPDILDTVNGMTPGELWRSQPYLRTVVNFIARNVAQLGLHTFRRHGDTDRERLTDHPSALLLRQPNPTTTCYELIYSLVADLAVYDRAYWYLSVDPASLSGYRLTRLPPAWVVGTRGGDLFTPGNFMVVPTVNYLGAIAPVEVNGADVLYFHGWNPDDPRLGATPIEALKHILAEQMSAARYRQQVWDRAGRASSVISRPADAPPWSEDAKKRFKKEWRSKWAGDDATEAGGTPILEDGMTMTKVGFSAHEDEYTDVAKLALSIVASVYQINPVMVGQLENANYSNAKEFRRALYSDGLGSIISQIEDRLNTFLIPRLPDPDNVYAEFNIAEKLQGSFEEQATAIQSAVGRPWMTADEARARMNMPAMGGDAEQLVTPLNVLVGGQASPTDSGTQNEVPGSRETASAVLRLVGRPKSKGRVPDTHDAKHVEVLTAYFRRQSAAVQSRIGAKAQAWWDGPRWDGELSDDLYALAVQTTTEAAHATLDTLAMSHDLFNIDGTLHYLRAGAQATAERVNETTRKQVQAALTSKDSEAVGQVFNNAEQVRAPQIARTLVTSASGFGTIEAGRQAAGDAKVRKQWVTGENPRPEHAELDGEEVGIDEDFSNGLPYPGAFGDPDATANCNCSIDVFVA